MSNIKGDSNSNISGALGPVFFLWIKSCVCLLHHCASEVFFLNLVINKPSALSYKLMTVESVDSSDVLTHWSGLIGLDSLVWTRWSGLGTLLRLTDLDGICWDVLVFCT